MDGEREREIKRVIPRGTQLGITIVSSCSEATLTMAILHSRTVRSAPMIRKAGYASTVKHCGRGKKTKQTKKQVVSGPEP